MKEEPPAVSKQRTLRVTVPATSANLGAGFDVLGLALDLHNVFTVTEASENTVEISGYKSDIPSDRSNLFYQAFKHLHDLSEKPTPAVHIGMELRIPPGLGLGSSATAVVGGLVAANVFLGGVFDDRDLLREAVKLEHGGHADNVAPALMGGLVVNAIDGDQVISVRVPFPNDLKAVVFTPDFAMDTVQGRALLPSTYRKSDLVFNASRVALFLSALETRRYDLLRAAMQDRAHQPYRTQIFPLLPTLIEAALDAGAHGAALSGGGSSVLALGTQELDKIGAAMIKEGEAAGIGGEVRILNVDQSGAEAILIEDGV